MRPLRIPLIVLTTAAAALLAPAALTTASARATSADPVTTTSVDDPAVSFLRGKGFSDVEARDRISRQEEVPALAAAFRARFGERFAGTNQNQLGDGHTQLFLKRGSNKRGDLDNADAAGRETGFHGSVDVVDVAHSLTELLSTYHTLVAEYQSRFPSGILSFEVRATQNAVFLVKPVGRDLTPAEQQFATESLAKYGDLVRFVEEGGLIQNASCGLNACDPPSRGGVNITGSNGSCTFGFNVRSKADNLPYILTAGHCTSGTSGYWYNNGMAYGQTHSTVYGGDYDAGLISYTGGLLTTSAAYWTPRNWVLVLDSVNNTSGGTYNTVRNEQYPILSVMPYINMSSTVGQIVCKTGANKGTNCGQNLSYPSAAGNGIGDLMKNSACAKAGDSGAPFFVGNKAHGITSAGSNLGNPTCVSSDVSFYGSAENYASRLNTYISIS